MPSPSALRDFGSITASGGVVAFLIFSVTWLTKSEVFDLRAMTAAEIDLFFIQSDYTKAEHIYSAVEAPSYP